MTRPLLWRFWGVVAFVSSYVLERLELLRLILGKMAKMGGRILLRLDLFQLLPNRVGRSSSIHDLCSDRKYCYEMNEPLSLCVHYR